MNRHSAAALAGAVLLLAGSTASAQQVTVQQPSVSVFSVNTTVSAPDSGGAFVGAVGRSGSSRAKYGIGPLRSSTTGVFAERSTVGTRVTIHDLDELDRRTLAAAPAKRTGPVLSPRAESAYRQLTAKSRESKQFAAVESTARSEKPAARNDRLSRTDRAAAPRR